MALAESWTCSICGRHATISSADQARGRLDLTPQTSRGDGQAFVVYANLTRCPNPNCRDFHLSVEAYKAKYTYHERSADVVNPDLKAPVGVGRFDFLPTTSLPLSPKVPASVQEDYREAHLIRALSPKAAATLARRALQGMVRDFWGVTRDTLHQELVAIRDACAADLYQAMMDVKSLGNIGAHPERDISLIIEIAPGEAEQLLELIHLLDQEWYVARAEKEQRLARLRTLAAEKDADRKGVA